LKSFSGSTVTTPPNISTRNKNNHTKPMTYLPELCFELIKDFAGINGAAFHHKKIANMMNHYIDHFKEASDAGEIIPLVYEILFREEELIRIRRNEGLRWLRLDPPTQSLYANDLYQTIINYRFSNRWNNYEMYNSTVYDNPPASMVWLKLTTKPSPPCDTERVSMDTSSRNSCYHVKVKDLKQFCIVNKLPKKQYSALPKRDLISFILKYDFDN